MDKVIGVEARGFIVAGAVAYRLGAGFVPVRKKGKLPWRVHSDTYELEYGVDTLEVHADAVQEGERVLILDDVLATGGTAAATRRLVRDIGRRRRRPGLRFRTGLPGGPSAPRRTGRGGARQLRVTEVGHKYKSRTVT